MKTFKQFQEGLVGSVLKTIGKTKLIDIAKLGAGAYVVKKGAEFLGKKKGESEIEKKSEPKKPNLIKQMKDRTDATNNSIENLKNNEY